MNVGEFWQLVDEGALVITETKIEQQVDTGDTVMLVEAITAKPVDYIMVNIDLNSQEDEK